MSISKYLNPTNDVAFRKIFGSEKHKDILIHFINDVMQYKGANQIMEVAFISQVQNPEIAVKKESIVDVLCKAQNDTQIIVEMQVSPSKGFEKRAQYYAAKAYSRQLNQGQGEDGVYANLKEIIFIAISNYNIFPEKKAYLSRHIILDTETAEHDLKDFSFTFLELPKFKITEIDNLKTIIEKWCYFFKHANTTSEADIKKIIGSNESDLVMERAYEAINQFNWTEDELFAYDEEIKRIWDNKAAEDYAKDAAMEAAREAIEAAKEVAREAIEAAKEAAREAIEAGVVRGREEGMEKGREEGMEQGAADAIQKTAINMLKQGLDPRLIAQVTGLSSDDISKLQNKM